MKAPTTFTLHISLFTCGHSPRFCDYGDLWLNCQKRTRGPLSRPEVQLHTEDSCAYLPGGNTRWCLLLSVQRKEKPAPSAKQLSEHYAGSSLKTAAMAGTRVNCSLPFCCPYWVTISSTRMAVSCT